MFIPAPGVDLALLGWWARWVRNGRRARAESSSPEGGWVLTYTARYRVTVALIFLGFTALYAAAYFGRVVPVARFTDYLVLIGSIGLWSLVAGTFLASLIERVTITTQGVRRRSWHGRDEMAWSSVASIAVSMELHAVTLTAADGSTLRISLYLDGLTSLQDALEAHAGMVRVPAFAAAFPPRDRF